MKRYDNLSKTELIELLNDANENTEKWSKECRNKSALIDEINKYRIKVARLEGYIDRVLDDDAYTHEMQHEDGSVDLVRVRGFQPDSHGNNKVLVHTKDRVPF